MGKSKVIDYVGRPRSLGVKTVPHKHSFTVVHKRRGSWVRYRCAECPVVDIAFKEVVP